jgi:hypothetical protein
LNGRQLLAIFGIFATAIGVLVPLPSNGMLVPPNVLLIIIGPFSLIPFLATQRFTHVPVRHRVSGTKGPATQSQNYRPLPPMFKYFGGKSRLAHKIVARIPEHRTWVEPFVGGGLSNSRQATQPSRSTL